MSKNKFDVSKTFDIFNSETISRFREKLVKLVFVEAENVFFGKSSLITDISNEDNPYITVINNHKVYKLLNNAINKKKKDTYEN